MTTILRVLGISRLSMSDNGGSQQLYSYLGRAGLWKGIRDKVQYMLRNTIHPIRPVKFVKFSKKFLAKLKASGKTQLVVCCHVPLLHLVLYVSSDLVLVRTSWSVYVCAYRLEAHGEYY